jgi:thiamine transport system ATP-binding protein
MLSVEGVRVAFDGRTVLEDVDVDVGDGETVAILGPSGCGKTTLLRVIAGLQRADSGRVTWDGNDLGPIPPHERKFGLVFQEYALFPHRDVKGNVEFGLRMARDSATVRAARVSEVLDLVGLAAFADRRVAALSGGEQQRVALARALAVAPRLLMLDEPLGALDREWRTRLLDDFRALLAREHLPAIYVTHDQTEAFAIASRIVVMRDGRVVQDATPADLWRAPVDAATAAFLGFGPVFTGETVDGQIRTPWGEYAAPPGPVDVVLRPDAVRLDPNGSVSGAVARTAYEGGAVTFEVAPSVGPMLNVTVAHRAAPSIGDKIRLSIDPDALLVYPRTAD